MHEIKGIKYLRVLRIRVDGFHNTKMLKLGRNLKVASSHITKDAQENGSFKLCSIYSASPVFLYFCTEMITTGSSYNCFDTQSDK